jgi:hypothetical protein
MKRVFLLMFASALLATLGFAQTPEAGSKTDLANVKGCLGGSDGNYTVAEDGTRQIFKITTSSVDLKPHLGHHVTVIGHKTSGTVSSGTGDNSFAVTELNMISEHCAAAAAATVGAVVPNSQTVIEPTTATPPPGAPASTPGVEAAAPAATVSPSAPAVTVSPAGAAVSTPPVEAAVPAATVSPSAPAFRPAVEAAAPVATLSPSTVAVSAPTEKAAHSPRSVTHSRKRSATQAAAAPATMVSPSPETATPAAADAPTASKSPEISPAGADAAAASPASAPVSTPDAGATTPTVTHRAGSMSLLISFVVLVIVLGTLVPLLGRWRKRKMLERTGTPNLSTQSCLG